LINSIFDILEEVFANSFVHFGIWPCRTDAILDFVSLVSFEQNIKGQFFVDDTILIMWTALLYFVYQQSGYDFGLSDLIGLAKNGMIKIANKNLLFEQLIVLEQIDRCKGLVWLFLLVWRFLLGMILGLF
jgi:hypothetical protein